MRWTTRRFPGTVRRRKICLEVVSLVSLHSFHSGPLSTLTAISPPDSMTTAVISVVYIVSPLTFNRLPHRFPLFTTQLPILPIHRLFHPLAVVKVGLLDERCGILQVESVDARTNSVAAPHGVRERSRRSTGCWVAMLLRIPSSMITAGVFDIGERFHRSSLEWINGNNSIFSCRTLYWVRWPASTS
jgi:hypothetical protein